MFYQSPQDVIGLCLDIDNTILNWEATLKKNSEVDFNGNSGPLPDIMHLSFRNQDVKWYQLLKELEHFCSLENVELNVHIVSAKEGGDVDCTVDAVVSTLYPFLEPLNQQGQTYKTEMADFFHIPRSYLYAKHQGKIEIYRTNNFFEKLQFSPGLHDCDKEALPTIHIVQGNKEQGRVNSKAAVMQYIEAELKKRGKNPLAMILVDDLECFAQEVKGAGYHFICAKSLQDYKNAERSTRATYTTEHLMPRIRNAVNEILARWRLQKQQMYYMALHPPS